MVLNQPRERFEESVSSKWIDEKFLSAGNFSSIQPKSLLGVNFKTLGIKRFFKTHDKWFCTEKSKLKFNASEINSREFYNIGNKTRFFKNPDKLLCTVWSKLKFNESEINNVMPRRLVTALEDTFLEIIGFYASLCNRRNLNISFSFGQ